MVCSVVVFTVCLLVVVLCLCVDVTVLPTYFFLTEVINLCEALLLNGFDRQTIYGQSETPMKFWFGFIVILLSRA